MDLVLRVAQVITPVFLIIGVGYFYGRRHNPDLTVLNRVALDVLTPAIIYAGLASRGFQLAEHGKLLLGMLGMMLGCGLIGWPLARSNTCAALGPAADVGGGATGALVSIRPGETRRAGCENFHFIRPMTNTNTNNTGRSNKMTTNFFMTLTRLSPPEPRRIIAALGLRFRRLRWGCPPSDRVDRPR